MNSNKSNFSQRNTYNGIPRRTNSKSISGLLFVIFAVVIFFTAAIIVAVSLRSGIDNKNKNTADFLFDIGGKTYEIAYDEAVKNEVIYIDMALLTDLCDFIVGGRVDFPKYMTSYGESIAFSFNSAVAEVNGQKVEMSSPALAKGSSVIVPLEFIKYISNGIIIDINEDENKISINRKYSDDIPEKITFSPKSDDTLPPISEELGAMSFSTDLSEYEQYMNPSERDGFLTLINKVQTIVADSVPEDLVSVPTEYTYYGKSVQLRETAEKALEAMMIEMYAAGFDDIFVTSGYRSYNYQASLFENYVAEEMASGISRAEAEKIVETYSARPGTSEHQSGLCVDLISKYMSGLNESFADNDVYEWLCENAWKFGFILRFPQDKTAETGYSFEPWHYRFVGRYHAARIHMLGFCLEEYTEYIK